jgi:regulator of protease activity HflC (stomatin/prohibitin superfamily)
MQSDIPALPVSTQTAERLAALRSGWPMFALAVLLSLAAIVLVIGGAMQAEEGEASAGPFLLSVVLAVAAVYISAGFLVLEPNSASVLVLLGRYHGTVREPGWWWVNPLTVAQRRKVSLRANTFTSDTTKVNDANGNPINIGAVVVWQVIDPARAVFDVEDYTGYVVMQSETAIRHLARSYPYDSHEVVTAGLTLIGDSDELETTLRVELLARLAAAGVRVIEARLTTLAYAPEIAEAMLRRQQAGAVVAARTRIVEGAVGMVRMALEQIQENGIVDMDEERKATMVSNLLTVLCSEHGTSPVVNVGTLNR